jgi:hypothetical protein
MKCIGMFRSVNEMGFCHKLGGGVKIQQVFLWLSVLRKNNKIRLLSHGKSKYCPTENPNTVPRENKKEKKQALASTSAKCAVNNPNVSFSVGLY